MKTIKIKGYTDYEQVILEDGGAYELVRGVNLAGEKDDEYLIDRKTGNSYRILKWIAGGFEVE